MHFRYGIVDLRGLPDGLRYGETIEKGEMRRVLDDVQRRGWSFLLGGTPVPGLIVVGKLEVRNG